MSLFSEIHVVFVTRIGHPFPKILARVAPDDFMGRPNPTRVGPDLLTTSQLLAPSRNKLA